MRFAFLLSVCAMAAQSHALTPLSAEEIRAAVRLIRSSGRVPASARFSEISLAEPAKELVVRHAAVPRRAFAIIYDYAADKTWEAIANVTENRVDSLRQI